MRSPKNRVDSKCNQAPVWAYSETGALESFQVSIGWWGTRFFPTSKQDADKSPAQIKAYSAHCDRPRPSALLLVPQSYSYSLSFRHYGPTLFPHQKSLLPVEKRPRTSTTEVRGEPIDFGRQRRHSRFQTSSRRRHRLDCPIPNRLPLERAHGQLLPSAVGTAVSERPPERF